ncbi:hypothetical protein O181_105124 [Austropuccinia psidii MF-1]|uniref:Uncharacterized protein n=1 Tax=Austropuccinia psidii MF-1 TaxID=1389203 RepID=A0A9Q3JNS9_9BASI|nr:hypothetical protein [Austropuccinia psidii MF-1]
MTDSSNQESNPVLMKEAPQLKEWPTFTGEGDYDHVQFIKTINMLKEDYAIPDQLITARLHSLFETSARSWYYGIRKTNENEFENSFLDPDKDEPLTWLSKQAERLNALYPEMSQKMVHMKILQKDGGELKNSLRSRCIELCSTEEYISSLEDIVTRTKIGRAWKKVDIKGPKKHLIKKDKPREAFKPNNPKVMRKENAISVELMDT